MESMKHHDTAGENRWTQAMVSVVSNDKGKGHHRNQSQAPLLEKEQSEEEEAEEEEKEEVRVTILETENDGVEESIKYPGEYWKTALAFLFQLSGMVTTTIALIITNENVPETHPLPDMVLDRVVYWSFGVKFCEWLMVISILVSFTVTMAHKHRSILLRRIFFMLGLMYYYRAVTMSVTVLPKPDMLWQCSKHHEVHNKSLTGWDVWNKLSRIAAGGGISLGEDQQFCGDYIFSGHTMCLSLAYLVAKEYSPKDFRLLHWFSFLLFISGVSALLAGRGHYTVDVVLGYWVITRVWATYHSLTLHHKDPYLATHWWWRVFRFMEGSVPPGPLPAEYCWPVPSCIRKKVANIFRKTP